MAPPRVATDRACVAVACSGGRDSAALLVATVHAAVPMGIHVVALHVHHGLSPRADAWLAFCAALASRLGTGFAFRRLQGKPGRGDSVEAWARKGRYQALREMAVEQGADLVLLAHHRRDQAETLLLQALRGAGPAGLAAMPRSIVREQLTWARPWLDQPRSSVEAYAAAQAIDYVDDDSNSDTRFARNRLRLEVWPALLLAFPDAEASLGLAARRAQSAQRCLDEIAALDLAACADDKGLRVADWRALSVGRRDNLMRAWLRQVTGHSAPQALIERLSEELDGPRPARWQVEGGELRSYRSMLRFEPESAASQPLPEEPALRITRAGRYRLPGWGGVLVAQRVAEHGVAVARLATLTLRARQGGEAFQQSLGSTPRSLKKQYQAQGIAAWDRDGPLLFDAQDQLLFVPGLGIDARAWAAPGEAQLSLAWERAAAAG